MPDDPRVIRSPDALAAEVDAEIVLLNMATGYFHQLNAVGSYLWRRLDEPHTVSELCRSAIQDFEADEDVCRQDVHDFVQELLDAGLVGIE